VIEAGARLVESDGAIACSVAGVDDLQMIEMEMIFENERCLFGNDEYVERFEEIQIVAVHQEFSGRDQSSRNRIHRARQTPLQLELNEAKIAIERVTRQRPNFLQKPIIRCADDDLGSGLLASQSERDRQRVGDLVDLIVIKKESDAHSEGHPRISERVSHVLADGDEDDQNLIECNLS
jgi:hypothetical protein